MQTYELSYRISEAAFSHKNDIISNALSRLSLKIDKYGNTYYDKLNTSEKQLLSYVKNVILK